MQMNPKYYYDNFVKPNYDEFCADEGSLRKAFNAVVSLFHMTDNYFNFYKSRGDGRVAEFNSLRDFQVYLGSHTSYFHDVQSMANAYKHLYTNSGKAHVTVSSGGAVFVEESTDNGVDIDTENLEGNSYSVVFYLKNDKIRFEVKDALDGVMRVWEALI
jgi:hypothetical protein